MRDLRQIAPDSPDLTAKDRVRVLASRQFGVVARHQLRHLGVAGSSVGDWIDGGDLHPLYPGVYAVGHTALSAEGRLTAALLRAGPGAMLSHGTAAFWLGLTKRAPQLIHVSTPRQVVSPPGVVVHGQRELPRVWHRALPVAPLPDVLLDYASAASLDDVRYVLAQAEYHGWLDIDGLVAHLRQGRPGSAAVRRALTRHQPQLAHTRSEFERRLLALCERHGIPVPELNVWLEGYLVDALWREQKVVVETDGRDGHTSWARIQADRQRDLKLRAAGFVVLRYTWKQLTTQAVAVAADIRAVL
jgi:very-short-patch-repair endonuclease